MHISKRFLCLVAIVVFFLLLGTLSFHFLEGWSFVDSFYFSGVTLTTIGYGDLHPTNDVSKIFIVFYSFVGVGLVLFALTMMAGWYFRKGAPVDVIVLEKSKKGKKRKK